jgi:hypothetical protein
MAKTKLKSSRSAPPVTGGSTHMNPGSSAGPQKPGQSASMGRGGGKFGKGGGGHMFGKQQASPAKKK